MAEARVDAEWDHTAAVLCILANINRDPKKHGPFRPDQFHPFRRSSGSLSGVRITPENIGLLKKVFVESGHVRRKDTRSGPPGRRMD